MSRRLSRKHLFRWAGAAGGGLALGAAGYAKLESGSASADSQVEQFHGTHQAGIVNAAAEVPPVRRARRAGDRAQPACAT